MFSDMATVTALRPSSSPSGSDVTRAEAAAMLRAVLTLFDRRQLPAAQARTLLVSAGAKTNPRVLDAVGNLGLVPVSRRVSGPTASLVMGAFTHASPDRPSGFSDGSYGVWASGGYLSGIRQLSGAG